MDRWLNGTKLFPPWYVSHQRRRNRKSKAKYQYHCEQVIKPESKFQLSSNLHFIFHEPIPTHTLKTLCGSRYFTRHPNSISKFQYKIGTELNDKLKGFLTKTQYSIHANHIKACMACANVLCGLLGSRTSQYLCTTEIIWDTGASF